MLLLGTYLSPFCCPSITYLLVGFVQGSGQHATPLLRLGPLPTMRNTFGSGALLLLLMVFATAQGEFGGIVSAERGGGVGGGP